MQNFVCGVIRNSFLGDRSPLLDACMGQPGNVSKCKQVGTMAMVL
jgi:hypothetical protein